MRIGVFQQRNVAKGKYVINIEFGGSHFYNQICTSVNFLTLLSVMIILNIFEANLSRTGTLKQILDRHIQY